MKILVKPHNLYIDEKSLVNEKELNITKVQFVFEEEMQDFVKEAYFTLKNNTYKVILENNECNIPYEVLEEKGQLEIGVVAFKIENDTEIRYNPSPVYINTLSGSLKDAVNSEEYTPTDKEQIEQMLDNINIDANKQGIITTITITNKDGTTKTVTLEDGKSIEYNWQGTRLGIKREDESTYQYVDLKGDKGEPGAIKMVIVNALPLVGDTDTIYLVPLENPETQENNYAEYIYVNGQWELLGKIGIQVDLSNYYTKTETNNLLNAKQDTIDSTHKLNADLVDDTNTTNKFTNATEKRTWNDKVGKTDYATNLTGGVIKISSTYGLNVNSGGTLYPSSKTYAEYQAVTEYFTISKGTLENVLDAKIGAIDDVLDAINGEVI